jgi:hypothetical protein
MEPERYSTPEEAATADFSLLPCRIVRVDFSDTGDDATVELMLNEDAHPYRYFVYCARDEGGLWAETHSSN